MKNIKKLKQIITIFLVLTLFIQSVLLYKYYKIDKKSSFMVLDRTAIAKNFSDIKYNIVNTNLFVINYLSGDRSKIDDIKNSFDNTNKSFKTLIDLEKNKMYASSKLRDSRYILDKFIKLNKEYLDLQKTTFEYIKTPNKKYNQKYTQIIKKLEKFEYNLDAMFKKVFEEFQDCKNSIYLIMFLSMVVMTTFLIYFFRREILKINHIDAQNRLLEQQSKLAAMGELLDIVAHQWKQPLNIIGLTIAKIEIKEDFSEESFYQCRDKIDIQLKHLVETLDQFRSFFREVDTLQNIDLKTILNSVQLLLHDDIVHNNIDISIDIKEDITIKVIPNEVKHIFINLINNSKDAFIQNDLKNRKIDIKSFQTDSKTIIEYKDNAGGIPNDILSKIFDLNYTTKKTGTGVGLYMCKEIVEKIGGDILVENIENGVSFKIIFNNKDE